MAEQLDEDSLDTCSGCSQLSVIVESRPLPPHLVGRGAGPLKAFARLCASCAPDSQVRRSPRSSRYVSSTTPPGAWWNRD
jgi:hypothetical protein